MMICAGHEQQFYIDQQDEAVSLATVLLKGQKVWKRSSKSGGYALPSNGAYTNGSNGRTPRSFNGNGSNSFDPWQPAAASNGSYSPSPGGLNGGSNSNGNGSGGTFHGLAPTQHEMSGSVKHTAFKLVQRGSSEEARHRMNLFQRYCLVNGSIDEALNDAHPHSMGVLLAWLRLSSVRELTWYASKNKTL